MEKNPKPPTSAEVKEGFKKAINKSAIEKMTLKRLNRLLKMLKNVK